MKIPGASSGAFDQTIHHVLPPISGSGGCERKRAVSRPLAHARGYPNQGEASFAVSNPTRMNADEYLKLAEVEDGLWYFHSLHRHVRRELRAALGGTGGSGEKRVGGNALHLLDAGCGTGGMILRLRAADPGWKWSGIDFMPLACELARKRCAAPSTGSGQADVDIRVASITELPFADGSFDAVVSADVVCQVDNPEVAAREFFRVLRPGGIVIVNVPAYMWLWSYHDDSCQTKHRYTRPEMAALLGGAGFQVTRLTHLNAIPFPLIWAKRKLFSSANDTSDMKAYPAPIDAAFRAMTAVEHAWLKVGPAWAWGTSVFAVGRKPDQGQGTKD
ncbi:MAG: class I SAM-dependent methyltransferase [Verrucomicrobia bacterium]|nr:class I SAM-dependent methyltransferase [Verrucomicrobiota bacterium]